VILNKSKLVLRRSKFIIALFEKQKQKSKYYSFSPSLSDEKHTKSSNLSNNAKIVLSISNNLEDEVKNAL